MDNRATGDGGLLRMSVMHFPALWPGDQRPVVTIQVITPFHLPEG